MNNKTRTDLQGAFEEVESDTSMILPDGSTTERNVDLNAIPHEYIT